MKDNCWQGPDNCYCDRGKLKPVKDMGTPYRLTALQNVPKVIEEGKYRQSLIQTIVNELEGMKHSTMGIRAKGLADISRTHDDALQDAIKVIKQMDV